MGRLNYDDCLTLLLDRLGRPVEVTIAPGSDELIILASFGGQLIRAKNVAAWAQAAGSDEGLFFSLDEEERSGFVLYPSRFESAYTDATARGWGLSIAQHGVRIDLWFPTARPS